MIDTKAEITRCLAVLIGLEVSGVNHAANMLTLGFGPLRMVANRRSTVKQVGAWALHIQCGWRIEGGDDVFATQADFIGSDDEISHATERMSALLVASVPATVTDVRVSVSGGVLLVLSKGLHIVITPDGIADEEDWRFFSPGSDDTHFVIEGGAVDPYSLS